MSRETIIARINTERDRQISLAHGGDTNEFDKDNSKNDWVAYITAYAGRAADKISRNVKEGCNEFIQIGSLLSDISLLLQKTKGGN